MPGDAYDNLALRLRRIEAKEAIRETFLKYVRGVDRMAYGLVRSTYHDDASDNHGPFKGGPDDFIDWLKVWHKDLRQSVHFVGNSYMEFDGSVALVETPAFVIQRYDRSTRNPNRSLIVCRYVDRWEERGDLQWKVAHRVVVIETTWHTSDDEPQYGPEWAIATRDAHDPLWSIRGEIIRDHLRADVHAPYGESL